MEKGQTAKGRRLVCSRVAILSWARKSWCWGGEKRGGEGKKKGRGGQTLPSFRILLAIARGPFGKEERRGERDCSADLLLASSLGRLRPHKRGKGGETDTWASPLSRLIAAGRGEEKKKERDRSDHVSFPTIGACRHCSLERQRTS